ncbi:glycosyltransferase family 1 protein [Acinetobacter sp. ANC 4558]|uniref:glycosyltransferase family 4 protein n=1 Tax=Acinetobacter sp. ANC 4558 TaxID=1977876 RepID=UPI000A345588|nr:glycosyltransferase family 4 protein [Acinetobacter sp. ANC 4558]OTG86692.1 glycosyltransferase family 1 protein [Acinetobacter sp. ANC 4558]
MKFLMISSYLPSVLNFRGKLLEAIHAQGFEIHIFAPNLNEFQTELNQLNTLGYQVYEIPMQRTGTNPVQDLKTFTAMYQLMREICPDYVLSYTIKPVIYGTLAAWLAKVPHRFALITGLGYAFQNVETGQRSFFQKMVHRLYAQALKHAHQVFFQNPDDLKLFRQMHLLNQDQSAVVVNGSGVNVQDFDVIDLPKNEQGEVKVSFLLIARLLGDKGIREYAQAARIVKQQYPTVEFHLVGWIDENPSAISQQELETWVAEKILNYWGKLSDVRPAIAASSVYVLPSYREGTPRTVLEAMAMGRAIITTDAPGCRETVIQGENGYLVTVKSVDALVQVMNEFIKCPDLMISMGQASRKLVLNKYDVNRVNTQMMSEMGLRS